MRIQSALRLALASLLAVAASGCAFLNRDNTPTYNWVEANLWPESKGARIAAFPLIFPVGFVAVAADAFVVHPATVIDDAARDAKDAFWSDWDWDDQFVTECAALPWRAIATPPFFLGDFLGRSIFDIPDRADRARDAEAQAAYEAERKRTAADREARARAALERAKELSAQGKHSEALLLLGRDLPDDMGDIPADLQAELQWRRHEAALRSGWTDQANYPGQILWNSPFKDEYAKLIADLKRSHDPALRWRAYDAELQAPAANPAEILALAFKDADVMLRSRALQRAEALARGANSAPILKLIEAVAASDPSAQLKEEAAEFLKKRGEAPGK